MEAFAAGNNLEIFWHHFEESCKHDQRLERKVAGQGAWGMYEARLANCFYIWGGVEQHEVCTAD